MTNKELIIRLNQEKGLKLSEWTKLLRTFTADDREYAAKIASGISEVKFGRKIYFRGIIEFSNICKNNCFYCGIRKSNSFVNRYRLTNEDVLTCCGEGYKEGFRTFVLQSGEDKYFTEEVLVDLVRSIRECFPDCAITLSVGELSRTFYQKLYDAGADRYLLRHETADKEHYKLLHPKEMSWSNRIECLKILKEIGYQTGCGCMVGTPYQTVKHLAEDMKLMQEFKPEMIGIGPFLPHKDTPFKDYPAGSIEMTLFLLSLSRIMLPNVLMPATTALGTMETDGRQLGVLAGANVIMPNLSPVSVRKKYMLYDNKIGTEEKSRESIEILKKQMEAIGYEMIIARGDYKEDQELK